MLMKESAKKKHREKGANIITSAEEVSEIISLSNSLNTSGEVSIESGVRKCSSSKMKEAEKDKALRQLLKSKSFESVMKEQKRKAAW
ncbi:unnamed protein product [Sphagnum balticum]